MSDDRERTTFSSDFSEEIWFQTYKYHTDKTVSDTHYRVAQDLASAEDDSAEWTKKFYDALSHFKVVPGGRISSNAGTNLHGTTYINCFVSGADGDDQDSIRGIFNALTKAALTLKSEGGYGFCTDFIRPRGAFIHGVGVESPGAVEMLRLWDTMSDVITKGSGKKKKNKQGKNKIRKGAMMVTINCWHPDVEEFIVAKQVTGSLSKFNMSVLCTDEFMSAVKNHEPWDLIYPDTTHAHYKEEWNGDIKKWQSKGYPIVVHKTLEDAAELWDLIMTSTYNRNEPGILFIDRMNDLNNLRYLEHISATNPCGEQILPIGGVCLLGSINLTQFINAERTDWDYEKLAIYIPIFVRMLDNVNDKTHVPLEEQKYNLKNKRRIGIGYMGYGSSLYLMQAEYGSERGLELTDKLGKFVTNECYKASALIAAEKGAFPLYDQDKYLASKFVKQALNADTVALIKKHGIRNSHLTSIQPTGNSSIYSNNVSGGLEPVVSPEYVRTSIVPTPPDEMEVPYVEWGSKSLIYRDSESDKHLPDWQWGSEGDEAILLADFEGVIYKIDRNRGLTKETLVEDYAVAILKEEGVWDAKADWAVDIFNLGIKAHIDTMKIFAKYIDSAMSKTINIPNDYPYEDFKSLYLDMYDSGVIKGGTTYRQGTMTSVISADASKVNTDSKGRPDRILHVEAPKRPADGLPCEIHHATRHGTKWTVLIGLLYDSPYEIFMGHSSQLSTLSNKYKEGRLVKEKRGQYTLYVDLGDGEELAIDNVVKTFNNPEGAWATRMVSMALRHGTPVDFAVEQLNKDGNVTDINKVLARILKKYIKDGNVRSSIECPECSSESLVYVEGCVTCNSCGWSKCQ